MRWFISRFLGILLCLSILFPVLVEDVLASSKNGKSSVDEWVSRVSVHTDIGNRRDPFRPMKKNRSLSSSSGKPRSPSPKAQPISTRKNPDWKLLGIIDGQAGRQVVIQVSPQERVFVRSGFEVGRSGWIIKTIKRAEVFLVHSSHSSSGKRRSKPKIFILSFATPQQSS